jgi:hypothetical protein
MTSQDEDFSLEEEEAALLLLKICSENSLSPQERERRERAAQRLKEVYSSIPWYKEQGERHGDRFWRSLQDKAALAD